MEPAPAQEGYVISVGVASTMSSPALDRPEIRASKTPKVRASPNPLAARRRETPRLYGNVPSRVSAHPVTAICAGDETSRVDKKPEEHAACQQQTTKTGDAYLRKDARLANDNGPFGTSVALRVSVKTTVSDIGLLHNRKKQ